MTSHNCSWDLFQFILQADFLTTSNRENILPDRPWNLKLRDAVPRLFCEAISEFEARPNLRYDWLQYVPYGYFEDFMAPVVSIIKSSILLLGSDGSHYQPYKLIIVPQQYQTIEGTPLISAQHMSPYQYLALDYNASRDFAILEHLGVRTMSPSTFIRALGTMDRARKGGFSQEDESWFERVSDALLNLLIQNRGSHLENIQRLRIVPVANGSWVSAATGNIFFNTALDDIPTDLPFTFVRPFDENSSQYHLLVFLGITDAAASHVVSKIVTKHSGPLKAKALKGPSLLAHARFLCKYAYGRAYTKGNVKVLCQDGTVRPADVVYMDDNDEPPEFQPSALLGHYGAALLHDSYYESTPQDARDVWLDWLRDKLHISTSPRILTGRLSPEFSSFAHSAATPVVLAALRHHWKKLSKHLNDDCPALQDLRGIEVECSDGIRRSLDATYLARGPLRRFGDLPFLDISDPDSKSWDFLSKLGVVLTLNCDFYLKRLIQHSGKACDEHTEEQVKEIYQQLQARFHDDSYQNTIW